MWINSPMNYTGSKFKILDQILPHFDYSKPYFVDLFTGGGSVYLNVVDKYQKLLMNDVISDLIGIHQNLVLSDDIIDETKLICPDKNDPLEFTKLRNSYNLEPTPSKLWALMLSSTNNMMRFNQKFKYNQTFGKRSWNDNTDKKVLEFTNHIRKYSEKLKFVSKSFDEIEIKSDKFMVYCDPPYGRIKNEQGNIGKKQISEAGYNAFWKEEHDVKLYDYLHKVNEVGSSFMVSGVLEHDGQTCWMLDKLIGDGFKMIEIELDYNKVSRKGDKKTTEVIIKNF